MDDDTFAHPENLRLLFADKDAEQPMVYSIGSCDADSLSDMCVDGYFVAASRAAAQQVLALPQPLLCRLAVFGDTRSTSNDADLLRECFGRTGIQIRDPQDELGHYQVMFNDHLGPTKENTLTVDVNNTTE
eukprot:TRINITY_DN42822_c0_g1_i3.p2 TRINITY_DN42822_c0_g1~~TRINITY_DN42822_c0_g1_i3.p2  ORF type:complete len:131 (-),score=20.94 TRINITY_DN42822_c0_g1_i3:410-802(-)